MPLAAGTKLGPYEILAPLGAGGMGEVYRARDTRLDRTVAVKILPANLSSDAMNRARFEREAKAVSALSHPNICPLFDVGTQNGIEYLVMECLEGESLAQRLERGALPTEQALKIGAEIADALGSAHRSGVIHRDVKPGNIMLTKSGAKLLDFGLARPTSPTATLATMTAAVAQPSSPVTQEGTIVGTFQYMSPEQVEGKELDARSDIFSLGAVLYEMVTGKRAFQGKSQLSVASAILEKEPDPIRTIKPLAPASLEHVVRRCLAKDPDDRWQTGRDLAGELRWVSESASSTASQTGVAAIHGDSTAPAQKAATWVGWAVAGALALMLLGGVMWWRNSRPPEQTMFFSAPLPFSARGMAIAPDGRTVALVGYKQAARVNILWLYELGAQQARILDGTEGANFPFWSPDGKSIAFFADGKLKRIEASGGPAQAICDAPTGRGGTWNQAGEILFTPSGELGSVLNVVPASGGVPAPVSTLDAARHETSHRWPVFLPDGKHFLFMSWNGNSQGDDAIYAGELGKSERKFVVKSQGNAAYAEPGLLIFYREGTLFAQHFDAAKRELSGSAQPILTDVQTLPRIGHASYAVSGGGLLVAQSGPAAALSQMQWFDRTGKAVGVVGQPEVLANVSLSPDGKSVVTDKTDQANENTDVWIFDLGSAGVKRMTFDPSIDGSPVWGPDAKQLVFASARGHDFDLYLKNTDGGQEEKSTGHDAGHDDYPTSWSRDGKNILYVRAGEVWSMSMPEMKRQLFLKSAGSVKNGQFSPDGKWVAYSSNETGKWEVYVTSFPDAKGKWQISTTGGSQPRWRGDGKELFYLAPDEKMMAVPITLGATVDAGAPVALFAASPRDLLATSEMQAFDVTKDGQRFLINTDIGAGATQPVSLILNWDAKLK
ncbi:MAG TPA: protein kinase [Candidatus Acidoferrales bacterium]